MTQLDPDCQDQLIRELFSATDPTLWRKRKVEQIIPLNKYSYRARTSYQFNVPAEIVERVIREKRRKGDETKILARALTWTVEAFSGEKHIGPGDSELEIILPITVFPKRVLLDFSITNMENRPVTLLSRHEGSRITQELIRFQLARFVPGETGELLSEGNRGLIRTIVFLGVDDLSKRLREYRVPLAIAGGSVEETFVEGMSAFTKDAVGRFLHPNTDRIVGHYGAETLGLHRKSFDVSDRLASLRIANPLGLHNPICNPLIGVLDYCKLRSDEERSRAGGQTRHDGTAYREWFRDFIDSCGRFSDSILALEDASLLEAFPIIDQFVEHYIAYALLEVTPGKEFLIKIEQVVPTRETDQDQAYQGYHVVVGETRSTHVEITSAIPTELEQVPGETRVMVAGTPVEKGVVFGYSSHATKFLQHFYTTKSVEELERTLRARGYEIEPGSIETVELEVKYQVERTLHWMYRGGTIIAVLFTFYFFSAGVWSVLRRAPTAVETPTGMSGGPLWSPIVPLILTVWVLFARLRAQEPIVADRLRRYVWIVMWCAFASTAGLFFGAFWTEVAATWLGGVVGAIGDRVREISLVLRGLFCECSP